MDFDVEQVRAELLGPIEEQDREAREIFSTLVLPTWGKELHGFPRTLYGHMMVAFARIDLLSACWKGDANTKGQTQRMIDFMDEFVNPDREANAVGVQIWRHKLMHTGEPRYLLHEPSGKSYRWLLHWWEHLPREQHYQFSETSDSRILNLGLVYLIEDVKRAAETYVEQLAQDAQLQGTYGTVQSELSSYKIRVYW